MSSKGTILLISPYWKEPHRWMVSSYKLAELWQRLGYRVVVCCMGDEKLEGSQVRRFEGYGERVSAEEVSDTLVIYRMRDIFLKDPWNYGIAFGFSGFVNRIVKSEKPDIIVINKLLFWPSLAGIMLRLRGHRVIQLTDALVGMTWWPRGFVPKVCAAIYAWTAGWLLLLLASKVVFFHPQPQGLLKKLGIIKKSEVIPTGIDVTGYKVTGLQVSGSNGQNLQPSNLQPVTVTYVGRLESVKGVDDFAHAAVSLKKEFPNMNIQVVGWYQEGHPLVTAFEKDIRFTGLRDDIPALLAESDIFVLPSHSEGLSNALMEAMASGCACVASDVGGNAFLIQNSVSGLLFPAGDREALGAHLRRLMGDPAKRRDLGAAARRRIEEDFAWDIVGKKYETLFSEILAKRVMVSSTNQTRGDPSSGSG